MGGYLYHCEQSFINMEYSGKMSIFFNEKNIGMKCTGVSHTTVSATRLIITSISSLVYTNMLAVLHIPSAEMLMFFIFLFFLN